MESTATADESNGEGGFDLASQGFSVEVNVYRHQFTFRIPATLAEFHDIRHTDVVQFVPKITNVDEVTGDAEVKLEMTKLDEGGEYQKGSSPSHGTRVSRPEGGNTGVTIPKEFGTLTADLLGSGRTSLYDVAAKGNLRATLQSVAQGIMTIEFYPAAIPWKIPEDEGASSFHIEPETKWPVTKTLVKYKAGPGTEYDAYRLELPHAFASPAMFNLMGGESVAARLSHVDGDPVLVLDLEVNDDEEDGSHVRTIFKSDLGGSGYEQYRVLFSKVWIEALGWDSDTNLDIEPGPERIVVAREGVL